MAKELKDTQETTENSEVTGLQKMVDQMKRDIATLQDKDKPMSRLTLKNKTREHMAFMREFKLEDEVIGLVTKLYDVKEVKDKTEAKRFYGICKVDVLDPKTGKTATHKEVDYLDFLNNARPVKVKITKWEKKHRIETESTGSLWQQTESNAYVADNDFQFDVEYIDHEYDVEVLEGTFKGSVVQQTTGTGFNL
jgi:hypothetical protein